jgi:NADPH2:quinone reductase
LSNDGAGTVEASTTFARGTRVAVYGGAQLGISEDGLQQQWMVVEHKRLIELPQQLDLDEGAALPINYVTAYQALTRVGQLVAGQRVLVSGASGALGHALGASGWRIAHPRGTGVDRLRKRYLGPH